MTTAAATPSDKGESHRIYWQQWLNPNMNGSTSFQNNAASPQSRRELVTSSAAVRISRTGARAMDVTELLRQTLNISTLDDSKANGVTLKSNMKQYSQDQDCLVLVGTLYSLPRDYVQFEHEQQQRRQSQDPQQTQPSRSDPFHVVRTLHPGENPVALRDEMATHLQRLLDDAAKPHSTTRTIISPKLQWYFVPAATETASPIPNCIDLDGYCTAMEDEDTEEEEDEEQEEGDDDDAENDCRQDDVDPTQSLLQSHFPWLGADVGNGVDTAEPPVDSEAHDEWRRRTMREDRRYQQLSGSQSALRQYCMSGFLLKRSRRDPHVWRRVHCVLTDDYLWYVSRTYDQGSNNDLASSDRARPVARHGRIRLTRALLLEPAAEYAPLYRTPNAFEVVSTRGTSHIFRATSKPLQLKWIQTLSERIVQSFENSLLESAELIVADECLARNRRRTSVAVEPLWDIVSCTPEADRCSSVQLGSILRLGMEVAEYRECCRHVLTRMPAKSPVVVTTPRRASPRSNDDSMYTPGSTPVEAEPLDPVLLDIIRATWDRASALLARATHVALQVQTDRHDHRKPSRSIETQCRHIDYVINGRFRMNGEAAAKGLVVSPKRSSSSNNGASNGSSGTHDHDPPPMDLFDSLLTELQGLASNPTFVVGNGTTNGDRNHQNDVTGN